MTQASLTNPDGPARTEHFSPAAASAMIAITISAAVVSALLPVLLTPMHEAGQLSLAGIGRAAMAQGLGMLIAITLAAFMLRPRRLRLIGVAALLLAALTNAMTPFTDGFVILLVRFASGVSSGILMWYFISLVARQAAPARLFAIAVTAQASASLAFGLLLARFILPAYGYTGGFMAFAVMELALLALVPLIPSRMIEIDLSFQGWPSRAGLVALGGIAAFIAGLMALWVYAGAIMSWGGLEPAMAAGAINVALGAQLAGGITAILVAAHIVPRWGWGGGTLVMISAILLILSGPTAISVTIALFLFGFTWMFVPPFQLPLVNAVDATGRGGMLVGSAQLTGSTLGPLLASAAVGTFSEPAAGLVAIACLALSIAMMGAAWAMGTAHKPALSVP